MSGWGRFTWGQAYWDESDLLFTGYGAKAWNDGEWGNLADETVTLTGLQASTNVGSVTFDLTSIVSLTGEEATTTLGTPVLDLTSIAALTGVSSTVSVGSPTLEFSYSLSGQSATTAVGSLSHEMTYILTMNGPGDFMVGEVDDLNIALTEVVVLTGQQADFATPVLDNAGTLVGWGREGWGDLAYGDSNNKVINPVGLQAVFTLGSITLQTSELVSGQEATTAIGSVVTTIGPTIAVAGQAATTNLGSITLENTIPITGQAATSGLGTPVLEIGVPITGEETTTAI